MDRDRKVLVSLLALLALSALIAVVDISLRMQQKERMGSISLPRMGPGIGIVRIEGPIQMTSPRGPFGFTSGSEEVIRRLNELDRDPNIKVIVVRINSPGGTVGATQEIFQKLMKIRGRKIPLIASMGEIAASGGYYVASACDQIVANHGSITGSIGVIAVSPNVKNLLEKFGIRMNVVKSGKYKDMFSSFRDIDNDELLLLQGMIESSYRKFVKDVALGRNRDESEIMPFADGRVMSGETAYRNKLVDALGTFEDALDRAREKAKLSADCPLYEDMKTPFQQFLQNMEGMFMERNPLPAELDRRMIMEYRYPM